MSKKSKKERLIKICPRCGSKNIDRDPAIYDIAPFYICKSCGFGGVLFPEVSLEEAKKIEEKPINYSPIFAPTKKPFSVPLYLFLLTITMFVIIIIILSR